MVDEYQGQESCSSVVRIEQSHQGIGFDCWHSICCKPCMNWNDFYALLAAVVFIMGLWIANRISPVSRQLHLPLNDDCYQKDDWLV